VPKTAAAHSRAALVVVVLSFAFTGSPASAAEDSGSSPVIQVDANGGYVPIEVMQGNVPEVTVTADGRMIVQKTNVRYDRMARLRISQISKERIQEMLARAFELGLLDHGDGKDYGSPGVTDQPSTTVTITINGERFFTSVYALGFDAEDLNNEQQANREELSEFISDIAHTRPRRPFEPTAIAVLATPVDDVEGTIVEWPLAGLAPRCVIVAGADLDLVLPLAERSSWATRWHSGESDWRIVFRPLLPDEHTCQDIGVL
jgi:hypothetical protein